MLCNGGSVLWLLNLPANLGRSALALHAVRYRASVYNLHHLQSTVVGDSVVNLWRRLAGLLTKADERGTPVGRCGNPSAKQ